MLPATLETMAMGLRSALDPVAFAAERLDFTPASIRSLISNSLRVLFRQPLPGSLPSPQTGSRPVAEADQ